MEAFLSVPFSLWPAQQLTKKKMMMTKRKRQRRRKRGNAR